MVTANSIPSCLRCGKNSLLTDDVTGEQFCSKCGYVVSEKSQESGPEWRSFQKDGGANLKPSEYFRRQGAATFSDDPIALNNIGFTGADCLLWGSDYPHDEGTFPHSQSVIDRTFQGVSESDKRKIVHDNAARIYGME